jgi:hypothetical protein
MKMSARRGVTLLALLLLATQAAADPVSLRARDVRTFQVLDSRTLVVTTWHRHQWRIELSSFCIDLEGAHTIGFRTGPIHGEIDQFGSVLTRMGNCPIRKVSYIGREPPRGKAKDPADVESGDARRLQAEVPR